MLVLFLPFEQKKALCVAAHRRRLRLPRCIHHWTDTTVVGVCFWRAALQHRCAIQLPDAEKRKGKQEEGLVVKSSVPPADIALTSRLVKAIGALQCPLLSVTATTTTADLRFRSAVS